MTVLSSRFGFASSRPVAQVGRFATALLLLAAIAWGGSRGAREIDSASASAIKQPPPRDSVVIDSLSRLVNTDSVYFVLRRMLTARMSQKEWQRAECMQSQLMWHYGMLPADAAIRRMNDTLWRGDEAETVRRRLPPAGAMVISPDICGPRPPRAPARVDGVNLNGWEGPRWDPGRE